MIQFYVMISLVLCLIGLSKGGFGGTLGALGTPLLALVMPADQVIGLLLPVLMIGDVFAVASHWRRWDKRIVLLLIPGAVLGVVIGSLFIAIITPEALRRVLGVITLLFVLYKLFEQRILTMRQYTPHNWHGMLTGSVAGITSTLAHTGGPPVTIYLLMQEIPPPVFVATSALFFATLNWIKVPSYFYFGLFNKDLFLSIVWLLPLLPLSVWVGKRFATKINKRRFDQIIIVMLAISAVLLLVG